MTAPQHAGRPVALVGAGAMGRAFAVLLASAGVPVTLYARAATAKSLLAAQVLDLTGVAQRSVAVVDGPGDATRVGVVADPGAIPDGAGLIFTTKGPQLAEAVRVVSDGQRGAGHEPSWVGGLQNGVVKDDILAGAWGGERVLRMASTLNARVNPDGAPFVAGYGRTYVGSRWDADPEAATLARCLTAVDVPTTLLGPVEIVSLVWMKCVNAIGVFGVGALTRLPGNVAFTRPPLVWAYLELLREAAAICRAEGVALADFDGMPVRTKLEQDPRTTVAEMVADTAKIADEPPWYSSMGQDVIAGRPTEVETVFGDLVRRADRHGVEVPRLALAHQLIAGQQP
jgi:2-dehydropantoate 2-reductase